MAQLVDALTGDWRRLLSMALSAGAVLPMALVGPPRAPQPLQPLKSLLLLMVLPPLYAALSVRIEGRVIWGLYPLRIPFAIAATRALPATAAAALAATLICCKPARGADHHNRRLSPA